MNTIHKAVLKSLPKILALIILCFIFVPTLAPLLAAEPNTGPFNLIVCGETDGSCDFEDLIQLAKNLIEAMIILSTLIATAAFAYVGIILLTSAGNTSAKTKAKDIAMKVLKGYLWILGAWLLVYTITSALLKPEYNFILGKP